MSPSTAAVRPHSAARRLASSVWLPWGVGAALLVLLATVALVAGGRVESGVRVPTAVLDMQQSVTTTSAQSVRRSLNEGVTDLTALAASLAQQEGLTDPERLRPRLSGSVDLHSRCRSLYVVDQDRAVVAQVGDDPHQNLLPTGVPEPGLTDAVDVAGAEVILQYAPLAGPAGTTWMLAGEYDPQFLQFAMEGTVPASAWVVNADGRAVGSTIGFAPLQRLDRQILRDAAAEAGSDAGFAIGGGSIDAREVVTWAPAAGSGPAGSLGWGVVTARSLDTIALPHTQAREQGLLFGVLLLVISLGVFGWLYVMLMRPLQRLQQEAERLAYGDLRRPVEIRRYDEIGMMGRSLERVRVLLVRRRVQESASAVMEAERR